MARIASTSWTTRRAVGAREVRRKSFTSARIMPGPADVKDLLHVGRLRRTAQRRRRRRNATATSTPDAPVIPTIQAIAVAVAPGVGVAPPRRARIGSITAVI